VTVTVTGATLSGVTVTGEGGAALPGGLDAAGKVWTSSAALRSGSDYRVTGQARRADGSTETISSRFSTLTPSSTFKASILPQDDWEVGVGMPVMIYFSKSVKDKAAVERALSVTSTPTVAGAWHWMSAKEVQWRPESYWPSGTKVVVRAGISGVEGAPDVWGSRTTTSTFSIGSAMVSTVDVAKHTLTVTRDGKVIKTIPVTTGKRGYETRAGTKVIISRETSRVMDAATTGVDSTDPDYYRLNVKYAMRLTWSGEFLHAAPWSVGSQGRANVSHGCTGMSTSNAKWLFDHSKVGDVVVYKNSKRELEWGNGYTAWNMDFTKWAA
jgi:lipoprotein-anchoring transpeptidase ErfK/SrfK